MQSLNTDGCDVKGGRVVGINAGLPPSIYEDITVNRPLRTRDSISYKEDYCVNEDAFEDYLRLVNECTKVAHSTASQDVKVEGPSMIRKMRGLLHPSVKSEVDYEEAAKDISNVLFMWKMSAAAGKRAFIPDIEDRDLCYDAIKIFSLAAQEAQLIPEEFCQEFGDEGIDIYNDLMEIIGERDKNCLPFMNMCLRTWLHHLVIDGDLLDDMSPFNFDEWVVEKMATPVAHNHQSKTSYELMLAVFGAEIKTDAEPSDDPSTVPSSGTTSSPTPTNTLMVGDPTNVAASYERSSKLKQVVERSSKLKQVGDQVRKRLLKSHHLRNRKRSSMAANEEMSAAVAQSSEIEWNTHTMRSCREASQKMEDLLFSVGGAERIVKTLRYFRDRKAVLEVDRVEDNMNVNKPNEKKSKEGRLNSVLMDGLRNFLGMFHRPRGEGDKGGGRRTLEDQNVYDAIMAAINTKELTTAKLGSMLSRELGISRRQMKRGRALREDMEDKDKKNWVRRSSTVPKNAIKLGEIERPALASCQCYSISR